MSRRHTYLLGQATLSLFVMGLFFSIAGCVPKKSRYQISCPSQKVLRQKHMGLLQKHGVQIVSQGQTIQIILPTDLLFAQRSANFLDASLPVIKDLSAFLKLYKLDSIKVVGYSDDQGRKQFLRLLTERQAQVLADRLWPKHLDSTMIYSDGMGSNNPIETNNDGTGQGTNRRLVISFRYFPTILRYN